MQVIPSEIPNNYDYRERAFVKEDLLKTAFDQTKENRRPCGPKRSWMPMGHTPHAIMEITFRAFLYSTCYLLLLSISFFSLIILIRN